MEPEISIRSDQNPGRFVKKIFSKKAGSPLTPPGECAIIQKSSGESPGSLTIRLRVWKRKNDAVFSRVFD